jgi:ribonucleoside-diphosphate reductase subunit M2
MSTPSPLPVSVTTFAVPSVDTSLPPSIDAFTGVNYTEYEMDEWEGAGTGVVKPVLENGAEGLEGGSGVETGVEGSGAVEVVGPDGEVVTRGPRKNSFGGSAAETVRREREVEPLLQPDENRFVMFPIKHHDVWELYKKSVESFWRTEEVDLSKDLADWKRLTDDEQKFIKMVLAFFSSSDGIIVENLAVRFMNEVQSAEIRAAYSFQNFIENIHSEMYSLLIDTYIQDPEEKMQLFHAAQNYPCIKKKADWARKWISDGRSSFATRLLAFAIVEGIYFSSSFSAIFWLKQKNVMPGLCLSNEFISRDEGLHVELAVMLYNKLKRKVSKKKFVEMMKEAVEIEREFICDAIPCRMLGMNHDMMYEYIRYVANRLCLSLGYEKVFEAKNPFPWMETISIERRVNFFEHRVSDYGLADRTVNEKTFEFDADF